MDVRFAAQYRLRARAAIRKRVARFGIRVRCIGCDDETRHKPEEHGRLRHRRCFWCGARLYTVARWMRLKGGALRH